MPMHQLNLTDDATSTTEQVITPTQPRVDDPMLSSHNQAPIASKTMKKRPVGPLLITVLVTVLLGVGTGFLLNKQFPAGGSMGGNGATPVAQVATGDVKAGDVFGSTDASAFKDSASGFLEAGPADGEGSHNLVRPGGVTQTVTLTSSVTDLSKFDGMEVKVWGETFRGQKAGWLMDVGRVEVVNPSGEKPE